MIKLIKIIVLNLIIASSVNGQVFLRDSSQVLPPPPPMPPMPTAKEDLVYGRLQDMPVFSGCETIWKKDEREKCSDDKLHTFLMKNIKYPEEAKKKSITGTVQAIFVVDKNGAIINKGIEKGIGGGCDEEVLRVVGLLTQNSFSPQRARYQPKKVLKRVTIDFTEKMRIEGEN